MLLECREELLGFRQCQAEVLEALAVLVEVATSCTGSRGPSSAQTTSCTFSFMRSPPLWVMPIEGPILPQCIIVSPAF